MRDFFDTGRIKAWFSLAISRLVGLVRTWLLFTVPVITLRVVTGALEIKAMYRLSFLRYAIGTATRALGCRKLLSEDPRHGRKVGGTSSQIYSCEFP